MQKSLRPKNFDDYVGQSKIKKTLKVIINSAKKRKNQLDHILFFGKSGIGKTTLAMIVARHYNRNIKFSQGQNIEKKADLLALFSSINKGDIIFVDEIHGINKIMQELLYSSLEDGVIDIIIGPDGDSKIMRFKVPNFTLIGATTKINELLTPFKNRFGIIFKLENYNLNEIKLIIEKFSIKMQQKINKNAIHMIATVSYHNPRTAINIFKRVVDFAVDCKMNTINRAITIKTLNSIGIYKNGLETIHIEYLKLLKNIFEKKWASLENISSIMQENKKNIESFVEPILIEFKYLNKSSQGRKISNEGVRYLKKYHF